MTLAHARAIVPDLMTDQATPETDQAHLMRLAHWAVRYSPLVAADGQDGLLLDITGCEHLFGGQIAMLQDMKARLQRIGLSARIAVAETIGAAWGQARYGHEQNTPTTAHQLCDLPIQALRIPHRTVITLQRLGLKTVGQLTALPRPALARRFQALRSKRLKGEDTATLIKRLDQFTGQQAEALEALVPASDWSVRHAFVEPVLHVQSVELALPHSLLRLCNMLAEAELGVRQLALHCYRVDGTVQTLTVGTHAASRNPAHLQRLLSEHLDTLEASFGFDLMILTPLSCEPLGAHQFSTLRQTPPEAVTQTLDRLSARLGHGAVLGLYHRHSHIPENCQYTAPYHPGDESWQGYPDHTAPRPIRILERPEPIQVLAEVPEGAPRRFRWRRLDYHVTKAEGPERIAYEWWHDLEVVGQPHKPGHLTRDYYKVEVTDGPRFWLFRRGLYAVAGVRPAERIVAIPRNDEATSPPTAPTITAPHMDQPTWFMHGFFA